MAKAVALVGLLGLLSAAATETLRTQASSAAALRAQHGDAALKGDALETHLYKEKCGVMARLENFGGCPDYFVGSVWTSKR